VRIATLLALLALTACSVVEPADDPAPEPADVEDVTTLDCVVLTPEAGEVDGPAVIGIVNECAEPVECEVWGGGFAWSETVPAGEVWSTPQVCGDMSAACSNGSGSLVWGLAINCVS